MHSLRLVEIHRDGRLRLLAVQSVEYDSGRIGGLCHVFGRIAPVAVVVCRPSAVVALDMAGEQIPLETLTADLPELDGMLRDMTW